MKAIKLLIILFLILTATSFSTTYYVGLTSTGSGTGTGGWANMKAYSSFSFNSLVAGDIVYLDGKTTGDSVNYTKTGSLQLTENLASGTITITKDITNALHNGRIIITRSDATSSSDRGIIQFSSAKGWILKHLVIRKTTGHQSGDTFAPLVYLTSSSYIQIDSCEVYSNGYGNGISTIGGSYYTITNSHIEIYPNAIGSVDQCCLTIEDAGNDVITGNTLIQGTNTQVTERSEEFIFFGAMGTTSGSRPTYVIANNFMLWNSPNIGNPANGVAAIYLLQGTNVNYNCIMWIYNNIIKLNLPQPNVFSMGSGATSATYHVSLHIYNNTVYCNAGNYSALGSFDAYTDTIDIRNNIFVLLNNGNYEYNFRQTPVASTTKAIDYNMYYVTNANFAVKYGGAPGSSPNEYNWTQWRAAGFDGNSNQNSPTFAAAGADYDGSYALNSGSAGIDAGTFISGMPAYGYGMIVPRPQGVAWDMGAYEYVPTVTYYTLTMGVLPSGGGTVSPGNSSYGTGSIIQLIATPTTGYHFVEWDIDTHGSIDPGLLDTSPGSGDGLGGTHSTAYLTINGNATYYAVFTLDAPGTPTLSSPTNGQSNVSISPVLQWNVSSNADTYGLQVDSTGNTFAHKIVDATGITTSGSPVPYALSGLFHSHTYYWRVNATNTTGSSAYSSVFSFTTIAASTLPDSAKPVYPGINSSEQANQPMIIRMTWTGGGAATDSIQIVKVISGAGTTLIYNDVAPTLNYFTYSFPTIDTEYQWRVRANNAYGSSPWSPWISFYTLTCHKE